MEVAACTVHYGFLQLRFSEPFEFVSSSALLYCAAGPPEFSLIDTTAKHQIFFVEIIQTQIPSSQDKVSVESSESPGLFNQRICVRREGGVRWNT